MRWEILVVCAVAGCGRPSGSAAPTPTTTVAPPPGEPAAEPTAAPIEAEPFETPELGPEPPPGTYASPACGERKYERRVTLREDHTIEISDRVSPCPPAAKCVWSGIVTRTGRYAVDSSGELGKPIRLVLTLEDSAGAKGAPVPDHLLWWNSRGQLTEPDQSCEYAPYLGDGS